MLNNVESTPHTSVHTFVEQLSLQENLAVSDGNNVGRDVSGHVTRLKKQRRKLKKRL